MNGAPRIAPTPTAWVASPPPPNTIAIIGIIVSGSAVPTAASTESDGALGQVELAPEPLDAVREQLGPEQDHEERDDEDQDVHQAAILEAATIDSATTMTTSAETRASRRSPAAKKPAPATRRVRWGVP